MAYYSGALADVQIVLRTLNVGSGSLDNLSPAHVEESQKSVDAKINATLSTIYYTPLRQITRSGEIKYPDPISYMAKRMVAADLILNSMTGVDQNVVETAKNIVADENARLLMLCSGDIGTQVLDGQINKTRNHFKPPGITPSPAPVQQQPMA